jgi:hypothetical protein
MARPPMAPETEQNKFPPNLSGGMVQRFFSHLYSNTPTITKNVKNRRFIDSSLYLVLKATVALHQWHEKPFHRLTEINVVRLMLRFLARM